MAFSISRHLIMLRHRFSLQYSTWRYKKHIRFNPSSQSLVKGNGEKKEKKRNSFVHLYNKRRMTKWISVTLLCRWQFIWYILLPKTNMSDNMDAYWENRYSFDTLFVWMEDKNYRDENKVIRQDLLYLRNQIWIAINVLLQQHDYEILWTTI